MQFPRLFVLFLVCRSVVPHVTQDLFAFVQVEVIGSHAQVTCVADLQEEAHADML